MPEMQFSQVPSEREDCGGLVGGDSPILLENYRRLVGTQWEAIALFYCYFLVMIMEPGKQ